MRHRRELLKLIGVSPIAAGAVKAHAAELLDSPAVAAAASVFQGAGTIYPGGQKSDPITAAIKKQVNSAMDSLEAELHYRVSMNGLDPDLACLKSVSAVNKYRIQNGRNFERSDLLYRARAFIWPRSF